MRLLFAGLAALVAVAFAAPSIAQDEKRQRPLPTTKAKPGTIAYCHSLKTASSRSACLKRVSAKAPPRPPPRRPRRKKPKKPATTATAAKQPDVGELLPPSAAPAAAPPGYVDRSAIAAEDHLVFAASLRPPHLGRATWPPILLR